jgi:RNA polymerase sigma-70 factor (ECF subfamily)
MHIYSGALRDLGENDLVQLARQGSPEAFSELMRRSRPRLLRAAAAIVNSPEEAEDALQNASWKAYEHLANFRQESSFNTWLTTIVVNQARMRMREVRRARLVSLDEAPEGRPAPVPELPDMAADPEHAYASEELLQLLHQEIRRLPAPLRQVMLLYVENHSAAEAAERLGLSVAAAKTRLFRARQQLFHRMQRYAELPAVTV